MVLRGIQILIKPSSFPGSHSCDPHYSIIVVGHATWSGYRSPWIRSLSLRFFFSGRVFGVFTFSITDSLESRQHWSRWRTFLLSSPSICWMCISCVCHNVLKEGLSSCYFGATLLNCGSNRPCPRPQAFPTCVRCGFFSFFTFCR